MVKKNLALKIFLLLSVVLFAVSFLLYIIVMSVMPNSYRSLITSNYTEEAGKLAAELEQHTFQEAAPRIYDFCLAYDAIITLEGEGNRYSFGSSEENSGAEEVGAGKGNQTISTVLHFSDKQSDYIMYIAASANTLNQITQTFRRLLPIISIVILIIALTGAVVVSRFLAKPVIEISVISKRMTALDMTWRCKTNRSDEIGVLASNLNTMAEKLDATLTELTDANQKLQADIEKERRQEQQRVDFFRAVSHELKTPITILKGELEGMIYGVGEYKNRNTHLRQSMRTVVEMENLTREILAASRMAANDLALNISAVEVSQMVRECCRKWQGVAEDRNQAFTTEIEPGFLYQGDSALLGKAISNIIGNAVIHSPDRASVMVIFKKGVLRVTNRSSQIREEDLEHIYEPFYRADYSHNHGTGGSGLGLYIVKTILERHRLSYQMGNVEEGVQFRISFH